MQVIFGDRDESGLRRDREFDRSINVAKFTLCSVGCRGHDVSAVVEEELDGRAAQRQTHAAGASSNPTLATMWTDGRAIEQPALSTSRLVLGYGLRRLLAELESGS